jgi:hypothetical protein
MGLISLAFSAAKTEKPRATLPHPETGMTKQVGVATGAFTAILGDPHMIASFSGFSVHNSDMHKTLQKIRSAAAELDIRPGDIYEDCAWHPVLCVEADTDDDSLIGISLIDGSYPRCCSFVHCGVRKLSVAQAWTIRLHGPPDPETRARIEPSHCWWRSGESLLAVGKK